MLHYYRFHADLPHPAPARPVYTKRGPGSGWPEHCPPIRAAQAFGWDVINPFDLRFVRDEAGDWSIAEQVEVECDTDLDSGGGGLTPEPQLNAWFWEKGQKVPHVITDNVYAAIRHQCKVSTFLYLRTEPGWMLMMCDVPNLKRDFGVIGAMIETDWYYPAHPWHAVIELPRVEDSPITEVLIPAGEPLCRLISVQRAAYEAAEMTGDAFGQMFEEGQRWLGHEGRPTDEGTLDITGSYARQQESATFSVAPANEADNESDGDDA